MGVNAPRIKANGSTRPCPRLALFPQRSSPFRPSPLFPTLPLSPCLCVQCAERPAPPGSITHPDPPFLARLVIFMLFVRLHAALSFATLGVTSSRSGSAAVLSQPRGPTLEQGGRPGAEPQRSPGRSVRGDASLQPGRWRSLGAPRERSTAATPHWRRRLVCARGGATACTHVVAHCTARQSRTARARARQEPEPRVRASAAAVRAQPVDMRRTQYDVSLL